MKLNSILIASAILISCAMAATSGHLRNLKAENCLIPGFNGKCLVCKERYTVNNWQCVRVSDTCRSYFITSGKCVNCVDGANLSNGECIIPEPEVPSEPTPEVPSEPSEEGPVVAEPSVECYFRQVNIDNVCVEVNGLCSDWNNLAQCTACYGGYVLNNGACEIAPVSTEPCYWRQVRVSGVCVQVSDQCNTFDDQTALCTSCYGGYTLTNGVCAV